MSSSLLWAALERTVARLQEDPSIIFEKEPDWPEGLNASEINRLAGRPIFIDRKEGGQRLLIVNHPDGSDAVQWVLSGWEAALDRLKPDKIQAMVARTVRYLRLWQNTPMGSPLLGEAGRPLPKVGTMTETRIDPTIQDILDKAHTAEEQLMNAVHASQEQQARTERARKAWLRVAGFRDRAIPADLTGKALHRRYAELVVELGQVLRNDGWQANVDAVTQGPPHKQCALETLRRAMEADTESVTVLVEAFVDSLFTLGLGADSWLREGLMYEVLKIPPPSDSLFYNAESGVTAEERYRDGDSLIVRPEDNHLGESDAGPHNAGSGHAESGGVGLDQWGTGAAEGAKGSIMPKPLSHQISNFIAIVDVCLGFARKHSYLLQAQTQHRLPDAEFGRNESRVRELWKNSQIGVLSNGRRLAKALVSNGYPAPPLLQFLNDIERDGTNAPPSGENPSWPGLKVQLQEIALRAGIAGADCDQVGAEQTGGEGADRDKAEIRQADENSARREQEVESGSPDDFLSFRLEQTKRAREKQLAAQERSIRATKASEHFRRLFDQIPNPPQHLRPAERLGAGKRPVVADLFIALWEGLRHEGFGDRMAECCQPGPAFHGVAAELYRLAYDGKRAELLDRLTMIDALNLDDQSELWKHVRWIAACIIPPETLNPALCGGWVGAQFDQSAACSPQGAGAGAVPCKADTEQGKDGSADLDQCVAPQGEGSAAAQIPVANLPALGNVRTREEFLRCLDYSGKLPLGSEPTFPEDAPQWWELHIHELYSIMHRLEILWTPAPPYQRLTYQEAEDEYQRIRGRLRAEIGGPLPDVPLNQDGTEAGEREALTDAQRPELIKQLQPAVRQAYFAFIYAEERAGQRLEDKEAYNLLKNEGITDGAGDLGELADYQLPAFDTWSRYVRDARKMLGEQKYTRRRGRAHGRSIVRQGQVERQERDE